MAKYRSHRIVRVLCGHYTGAIGVPNRPQMPNGGQPTVTSCLHSRIRGPGKPAWLDLRRRTLSPHPPPRGEIKQHRPPTELQNCKESRFNKVASRRQLPTDRPCVGVSTAARENWLSRSSRPSDMLGLPGRWLGHRAQDRRTSRRSQTRIERGP